ncbi:MAG: Gmad2 immunoglobulin-like domain-containing protein [Candidatus Paceibacterota bacterium]|jgi:hypothetical protein
MTKKVIISLIILAMAAIVAARILTPEDTWICTNSGWTNHGSPSSEIPATPCEPDLSDLIQVNFPKPNGLVSSPLKITGKARGSWFFEASFPVTLVNWDGLIIAEGVAQATSDWMTEDFVPFEATLEFEKPTYKNNGALILKNDNPSGLSQNDKSIEIPILFK